MKLLILVAIIGTASAIPNLGSKKCSWGPAYWCQSYKEAEECGAIDHCKKKVWIMKPEDACADCEFVVNELKAILSKNTTQHKVIVYFEDFCNKFGGDMAPKCKALVDTYGPEILKLFLVMADTKEVCVSLGLCGTKDKSTIVAAILKNSIPQEKLLSILQPGPVMNGPVKKPHPVKRSDASTLCILCEFIMRELDNLVSKNSTQIDIEKALDKVCSLLPGNIRTECTDFINEYAPAILEILSQELNPSLVCSVLRVCTSQKLSKPVMKLNTKVATSTCSLCELVFSEMKAIVNENSTEEEIKNALERVCSFLPSTLSNKCSSFIDTYEPQLIQLLLEITPDEVCRALGLCKSMQTLKVGKTVRKPVAVQSSVKCVLCEFVMDKLEAILNDKPTEDEIKEALDKVCGLLPSSISADCKSFVDVYSAEIIKFLTEEFQPKLVCTMLRLCTTETHPVVGKSVRKPVAVQSSAKCVVCEFIMDKLEAMLNQKPTEDEIKEALDKVCGLLPSSISADCKSFMDKYAAEIIKFLTEDFQPKTVCTMLGICTKETHPVVGKTVRKPVAVQSSVKCVVCEFVMDKLEAILNQKPTEDEIKQALDKVCGLLPSTISSDCKLFVDEYSAAIIKFLTEDFQPKQVCTMLGLCTKETHPVAPKLTLKSNGTCDICKLLIGYAKAFLVTNKTEEEILNATLKICDDLPDQIKSECTSIVNEYGKQLLNLLFHQTPKQLCEDLGLCSSSNEIPCYLGASYWCLNQKIAVKCKALQYCKDHAW